MKYTFHITVFYVFVVVFLLFFLENIYSCFCSAPGVCRMMGYKCHLAIPASPYLYKHSYKP